MTAGSDKDPQDSNTSLGDSPNAVHAVRRKFKDLTKSILNSTDDNVNNTFTANNNSKGKDDNGGTSMGRIQPEELKRIKQYGKWDELCLGVWKQNQIGRKYKFPGQCRGVQVIRSNNAAEIKTGRFSDGNFTIVLPKGRVGNAARSTTVQQQESTGDRFIALWEKQKIVSQKLISNVWDQDKLYQGFHKLIDMSSKVFYLNLKFIDATLNRILNIKPKDV
ncbi:hypothetical protein MP228_011330 [Amoeboaphelidium protococcarum]|nr:hypothetical protein MP228_011330 [Amoeboaphelidium protococcarum]